MRRAVSPLQRGLVAQAWHIVNCGQQLQGR